MIFVVPPYLVTPYRPLSGASSKNDTILAKCAAHPERFLASATSGDPREVVAELLTSPLNHAWEVWRNDPEGANFVGVIVLDRVTLGVDVRWQFVFFDDELASKAALLNEFAQRAFAELGFHRLTFEAPEHMTVLIGFARRKLGFAYEGETYATPQRSAQIARVGSRRERAYFDGAQWYDIAVLRRLHTEEFTWVG